MPHPTDILAKCFHPADPLMWRCFLDRFGATEGRICYYPSAGSDFRPLVYQQIAGMKELAMIGESRAIAAAPDASEKPRLEYAAPDLWIFSDFCAVDPPEWLASGVLHRDAKVEVEVLAITEIYADARHFNIQFLGNDG